MAGEKGCLNSLFADMLAHEGFATPVVDMEKVTLTYPDVKTIAHDLRAGGATNLEPTRIAYGKNSLGRRRARLRSEAP